jgi:hypothetical protein
MISALKKLLLIQINNNIKTKTTTTNMEIKQCNILNSRQDKNGFI